MYYILDGKIPVPCTDLNKWAQWMGSADRKVANTKLAGAQVSTVFLGTDHAFEHYGQRKPILFETMIFGGKHDGWMERYETWDEAEAGHKVAIELVESDK